MIQMQEILDLSVAERILIIEKICDSIDYKDIQLSVAQEQELDSRLRRYEHGNTTFLSWNDIKSELSKQ
jgi:putative addiction module component (TIGR02574 family)